jgi:LacI family transcriptional regulator
MAQMQIESPSPFRKAPPARHVALAMDPRRKPIEQILAGIAAFGVAHAPWEFHVHASNVAMETFWERIDGYDGVIALFDEPEPRLRLAETGATAVLLVRAEEVALPQVCYDCDAIGRLAVEYFADKGFRHLAFVGYDHVPRWRRRREGFERAAAEADLVCHICPVHPFVDIDARDAWLDLLPRPVGLLACNTHLAHDLLNVLWERGTSVPEEIAVLGVDNEVMRCELSHPALSAIDHGPYQLGYRGAELLDALLSGAEAPREPVLISPLRVVERQSTDTFAVEDPDFVRALRRVRRDACNALEVADVVAEAACSRRTVEQAFKKHLGRGIWQEILRVRIGRARELLLETDLPTPDIAARAGFSSASKLADVFRRTLGQTPTEIRRGRRLGAS